MLLKRCYLKLGNCGFDMKSYRRSRLELYLDVLQAIGRGRQSPSKIVYAANISYDRVVRCINFLEKQVLVQRIYSSKRLYTITENGREVLHYFENLNKNMNYTLPLNNNSEKQTAFIAAIV